MTRPTHSDVPLAVLVVRHIDVYLIGLTKRTAAPNDHYSNGS